MIDYVGDLIPLSNLERNWIRPKTPWLCMSYVKFSPSAVYF